MSARAIAPSLESVVAGRYELVGIVGRGGMGSVHEAVDRTTGKHVALKWLSSEAKPLLAQLFEREYQTLAGLRHPGIVEVYEYGRDGSPYYTMELLSGGDLGEAAPMPWREVCRCLRDAASIVGLLHARQLLHRDLSPRNLWRTPDGALKLIDFGALSPFGASRDLAGTPPFVPPEALRMQALDQRADLFSLGALGYWLLSGVHAYPAQSLGELERLWEHAPPSFAQLAKLVERPELTEIPEGLEAVLRALLQLDSRNRPNSTGDLIDRLHALTDMPPVGDRAAVDGYVHSKAFVGRALEQRSFHALLRNAQEGRLGALFVGGSAGVGRSRLLAEFAITARLSGVVPVHACASLGSAPFAFTTLLAEALFEACPEEAREAAQNHGELLARLSPALCTRLGMDPSKQLPLSGELRPKLLAALQTWLLEVSQRRPLVLLADDLHAADEESQALLTVLAHVESKAGLALVASVLHEPGAESAAAIQNFRNAAARIELAPLTSSETLSLLRSMFGEAAFLERLAERLHRICEGNPGHCLMLVEHLVHSGAARHSDGVWELPRELSSVDLPRSRHEASLRKLDRLSSEERAYARSLSVPIHGELRDFVCQAAWGLEKEQTTAILETLEQKGVLARIPNGVRFAHEAMRDVLSKELDAQAATTVHLRMADAVLVHEAHPQLAALRASVHLLRAGAFARGKEQLSIAASHFSDSDLEFLRTTAPMFEDCVAMLRSAGTDAYTLALPLSVLSYAGYYTDRRYAERHGDETLRLLSGLLRLDLAHKLRPYLGAKPALILALVLAGFAQFRHRAHAPKVPVLVRALIGVATTLAGVASVCIDGAAAERCTQAIEPLAALGAQHAAGVAYAFCKSLAMRSRECIAETAGEVRRICKLLDSEQPISNMPAYARTRYLAGALFSLGVSECWRMGKEGLAIAERLESLGGFNVLSADHLRAGHHAAIGNMAEAARYRRRVELHAIEFGSAWQVETWASADGLKTAILTQDTLALKHIAQDLARLSTQIPSLAIHAVTARGAYLISRGKYSEAVAVLDRDLPPLGNIGWSQTCALFARALNGVAQHERAERVCRETMTALDPADFDFPLMSISLPIQYAMSEAGLGKLAEASSRLDALIARYAETKGALIAYALFEARAAVALKAKDFSTCEAYLARMEKALRPTAIQSLKERLDSLRRELARAAQPELEAGESISIDATDAQLVTRVQLLLRRAGASLGDRSRRALQVAMELTGAEAGFLIVDGSNEPPTHLGMSPDDELFAWAKQRLRLAQESDETAAVTETEQLADLNLKESEGLAYCVAPLWTVQDNVDVTSGVVALGFRGTSPRLPGPEVLRAIAMHLRDAVSEASNGGLGLTSRR